MSFARITTEQLDFLYPSGSDSRLQTILRTTRDPMTGERGNCTSTRAVIGASANRSMLRA